MSTHCCESVRLEVWRRVAAYFSEHPPKWHRRRNPRAERIRRLLGLPEPEAVYWTPDPAHPVEKECSKCGVEKHLMEFYLRYENGRRLARCKVCVRAAQQQYRAANPEKCRATCRRYRAANRESCRVNVRCWRERHRQRVQEHNRAYRMRYPRKDAVRRATQALRTLGIIEPLDRCEECGAPAVAHHHLHYDRPDSPYAVVALCRPCHTRRHSRPQLRHSTPLPNPPS